MRIREIVFEDYRSFRGKKQISFVDPLTGAVRPITIIAGTNGTGKTTILDTMQGLLQFILVKTRAAKPSSGIEVSFVDEVYNDRAKNTNIGVYASVEFSSDELMMN